MQKYNNMGQTYKQKYMKKQDRGGGEIVSRKIWSFGLSREDVQIQMLKMRAKMATC